MRAIGSGAGSPVPPPDDFGRFVVPSAPHDIHGTVGDCNVVDRHFPEKHPIRSGGDNPIRREERLSVAGR